MLLQYLDDDERREYKQGSFVLYTKEQSLLDDHTPDGRAVKYYQDGITHCAYCGDEIPNAFRRKYCSQRCRNDAYMARRRERQKEQRAKVCPVCGKRFDAERKSAVYCSCACKQKAYRLRTALLH